MKNLKYKVNMKAKMIDDLNLNIFIKSNDNFKRQHNNIYISLYSLIKILE